MNNSITDLEAKKLLLSSPWDTIKETIEKKGISEKELAEKLGENLEQVQRLKAGNLPINDKLANKLEQVLNVKASLWINLEKRYRQELKEIQLMESNEKQRSKVSS